MYLKSLFKDGTINNTRLLIRAETQIPQEWRRRFHTNVAKITPMKTGRLRRSIRSRFEGNRVEVRWGVNYAIPQNQGGHGNVRYRNYTTPGTGPKFANIAFKKTNEEIAQIVREIGLTK